VPLLVTVTMTVNTHFHLCLPGKLAWLLSPPKAIYFLGHIPSVFGQSWHTVLEVCLYVTDFVSVGFSQHGTTLGGTGGHGSILPSIGQSIWEITCYQWVQCEEA